MPDDGSFRPLLSTFAFVIAVPDLDKSAAYYRDVLDFTLGWTETDDWRLVERDGVRLMLGRCPDATPARDIGDHSWIAYLHVDDIDALHAEFTGRGAACNTPQDKPQGIREMLVTTPDGHRLMVGQILRRG